MKRAESGAKTVFFGMGFAALIKYIVDGMKIIPAAVYGSGAFVEDIVFRAGISALIGVGYICGVRIASYMFAGAVLGWFVFDSGNCCLLAVKVFCYPVRCQSPLFITRAGQVLSGTLISDILELELWRQEALLVW